MTRIVPLHEMAYSEAYAFDLYASRIRYDLNYYKQWADYCGQDILELCCGTGRIMLPLLAAGMNVHGVDMQSNLIDFARRKISRAGLSGQATFHVSDAVRFSSDHRFDYCLIGYNSLVHIIGDEPKKALMETIHRHLRPGGYLSIHIYNHPLSLLFKPPRDYRFTVTLSDGPGRKWIFSNIKKSYHHRTRLLLVRQKWRLLEHNRIRFFRRFPYQVQIIFPEELKKILKESGFNIIEFFGDFHGSPFHKHAYSMVVTARRC